MTTLLGASERRRSHPLAVVAAAETAAAADKIPHSNHLLLLLLLLRNWTKAAVAVSVYLQRTTERQNEGDNWDSYSGHYCPSLFDDAAAAAVAAATDAAVTVVESSKREIQGEGYDIPPVLDKWVV